MSYRFDIIPQNFTCPDFHTCTLMDTFADCQEKVKAGMQAVCQAVSTNLTELVATSCGRRTCFEPTGRILSGREMGMSIVHNLTEEKIYNFGYGKLTAIGLATVALGYGIYKIVKKMNTPPQFLENTKSLSNLTRLLDHANVSAGHLNGSKISYFGMPEKASFRQVSNRIEQLYSQSVQGMRKKQETYEWSQSETKPMGRGPGGWLVSLPFMAVESFAKTLSSGRPSLSADETMQVREAIECRKSAYYLLDNLYKKSQVQLDADTSYAGKIARIWDESLNKVSTWRKTSIIRDAELLNQMGTNPPVVEPVKVLTGLQLAHKESSRLLFGKELVLSLAHIVRDIALTIFYTFWVFSGTWKDNISSSFQDVRDDLGDFKVATIGVFSPSSAF